MSKDQTWNGLCQPYEHTCETCTDDGFETEDCLTCSCGMFAVWTAKLNNGNSIQEYTDKWKYNGRK